MTTSTNVQEIWKPLEQYQGNYSVSNLGRIKNNGFFANVCGGGKRWVKPRIRKLQNTGTGYKSVALRHGELMRLVHRLVAQEFIPNPENKPFVNHKDGDKWNNHVSNLEWCTRQENENHAFSTGLKNSTGSNNAMAKLTEKNVFDIKYTRKHLPTKILADEYNVHIATIQRIRNGKIWKHV